MVKLVCNEIADVVNEVNICWYNNNNLKCFNKVLATVLYIICIMYIM